MPYMLIYASSGGHSGQVVSDVGAEYCCWRVGGQFDVEAHGFVPFVAWRVKLSKEKLLYQAFRYHHKLEAYGRID
jgi:hypothetical protein